MRRSLQIIVLALAAAAALAVAGTASAKTPCWQTLIDDWYDGRIDSVYEVSCYRDALEHMPEDVAQYSTLEDDLNRALAAAIAAGNGSGGSTSGGNPAGGGGSSSGSATEPKSTFHGGPKANRSGAVVTASGGRDPGGGPVGGGLSALGPDSPDSVPIPLIVLGSLALLLLTLGSAGLVARRLQARRAPARVTSKL